MRTLDGVYLQAFSKQSYGVFSVLFHVNTIAVFITRVQDVTGGSRVAQFPGRRITTGASNDCGGRRKAPTMSQVLSSIQYICFGRTSGSNMGGAKLASCPGRHLTTLRPCACAVLDRNRALRRGKRQLC